MTTRIATLILLLAFGFVPTSLGVSFTYESSVELSATLDANNDGLVDLVLLDKASGVRQIGLQQADGSLAWAEPDSVGMQDVTSLTVGQFIFNDRTEGFAVASPMWNQVTLFPNVTGSGTTVPSAGIGPNLVVGFSFAGDATDDLAVASEWDNPPDSTHLSGVEISDLGLSQVYGPAAESGPLTQGNRARFRSDRPWMLGALRPGTNSTEFIARPIFNFPGFENGPTLTGLATNTVWVWGEFATNANAQFLFYSPGDSVIQAPGLVEPAPYQFEWTSGTNFDLGQPIGSVTVVSGGPQSELLVILGDGSTATLYNFDGTNAPTARQTMTAPNGMKYSLAGALGGGDFTLLHGANGARGNSTGWQHWRSDGQRYNLVASGALPPYKAAQGRADVLLYGADPELSSDTPLLQSLRVGEWSDAALLNNGVLSVTREGSRSSVLGLGNVTTSSVTLQGYGSLIPFPAVNQRSSLESAVVLSPPAPQPAAPITFSPAPGAYPLASNATLTIHITTTAGFPVLFRSNTGLPWTIYDPANPPAISTTTFFSAYVNANPPSPICSAAYIIGPAPALVPSSPVDANHNGLPDAWEQAFGLTDPNGDADGDGASNLQECLAGTDPLDPLSVPPTTNPTTITLIVRAPGASAPVGTLCEIAWPSQATGAVLQTTTNVADASSWSTAPGGIFTVGSESVYYQPAGTAQAEVFFRVHP